MRRRISLLFLSYVLSSWCSAQELDCDASLTFEAEIGSNVTFTLPQLDHLCTTATISFANGSEQLYHPYEGTSCFSANVSEQTFRARFANDTPKGKTLIAFYCNGTIYCTQLDVSAGTHNSTLTTGLHAECEQLSGQIRNATSAAVPGVPPGSVIFTGLPDGGVRSSASALSLGNNSSVNPLEMSSGTPVRTYRSSDSVTDLQPPRADTSQTLTPTTLRADNHSTDNPNSRIGDIHSSSASGTVNSDNAAEGALSTSPSLQSRPLHTALSLSDTNKDLGTDATSSGVPSVTAMTDPGAVLPAVPTATHSITLTAADQTAIDQSTVGPSNSTISQPLIGSVSSASLLDMSTCACFPQPT